MKDTIIITIHNGLTIAFCTHKDGNGSAFEEEEILLSGVTTIVKMVSYVLIAFVAISLIVSGIMISIITYISVLERTKEIGILRAIGASKKDPVESLRNE